ncbi:MAG TPA: hypothetical protein VIC27_01760 [Ktedonobacterales bacterium]
MAREPATTAWGDNDGLDDDLIVTRQSLDWMSSNAAAPTARLQSIREEAADPNAGAAPHNASSGADAQRPEEPSAPLSRVAWGRNLTLRQQVLRGGAMSLLVALTLYLLLGGPAATGATLVRVSGAINTRLHPPKSQPTLAESGYTSIKSPPGAYNLPQISIAPAIGNSAAAWACWSSPYSSQAPRGVWSAEAFYTANAGARWIPLTLPQTAGLNCTITADGERPSSALIVLSQGLAVDGSCIAPLLYLTADLGASWARVPSPLDASHQGCQFHTALQGGAIYLWADGPLLPESKPSLPPTGRLIVSRDAGHTWAPADNGLDGDSGLDIVGFRPGGHILASIVDVRVSGGSSILMTSDDYGGSWRSLGALPGAFPQVFVSSDSAVTDHGGWGRLYTLARTVVNGAPSVPAVMSLASAYIGEGWAPIALPPLAAGASADAESTQSLVIGVGPAGALEVEYGIVESVNAQLSPSRRLWVWSPAQREWLLDPQVVPGNLELQGVTWNAGDQIFWMTTLQLGVPPVLQIFTKTYPADLLTHIQASAQPRL